MPKQKIEIEVDVPEGYEATGECRRHLEGESFICAPSIILRRVKQYREPVLPADNGKQCEFSDDGTKWHSDLLQGYWKNRNASIKNWASPSAWHMYCRIEKESS